MPENNFLEVGRLVYSKGYLLAGLSDARAWAEVDSAGVICAIRNITTEELVISAIDTYFFTTALSSAQPVAVAASWIKTINHTVLQATGARASLFGANRRRRNADMPSLALADTESAIAGAAPLTGGSFTFSPNTVNDPFCALVCDVPVGAVVSVNGRARWEPKDNIPWSLAADEGLILVNRVAFPAGLQGRFGVNVECHRA